MSSVQPTEHSCSDMADSETELTSRNVDKQPRHSKRSHNGTMSWIIQFAIITLTNDTPMHVFTSQGSTNRVLSKLQPPYSDEFCFRGFKFYLMTAAGGNRNRATANSIISDVMEFFSVTPQSSKHSFSNIERLLNRCNLELFLQVFAVEFVAFAIEFVPFAIEFIPFPIEFVPFAIEFVLFAIEFVGIAIEFVLFAIEFVGFAIEFVGFAVELVGFAIEFVAFALRFVINKMAPRNQPVH